MKCEPLLEFYINLFVWALRIEKGHRFSESPEFKTVQEYPFARRSLTSPADASRVYLRGGEYPFVHIYKFYTHNKTLSRFGITSLIQ